VKGREGKPCWPKGKGARAAGPEREIGLREKRKGEEGRDGALGWGIGPRRCWLGLRPCGREERIGSGLE